MITNQRQYLVAQGQAERFRQALVAPGAQGLHPKAVKAMRAGLRSRLDDIEGELAEYDALRRGQVTEIEADSIVGIGQALIKARIVRNLTQKELAERLSLAEQQVQRYEATFYYLGPRPASMAARIQATGTGNELCCLKTRPRHGASTGRFTMKFLLTLACATAMAAATTGASGQPASGAASAGASAPAKTTTPLPNDGTSRFAPGRATSDSNKMGISGPESPVNSDAPTVESCRTITAQQERDKCLARARQVERERSAASGVPAARREAAKP